MKKLILLLVIVLVAGVYSGNAQSLKNSAWKSFLPALNDTLTLHFGTDTSYVTLGTGDVVVRSICHISKDSVSMQDIDGQYACQNGTGIYLYTVKDDKLVMKMVSDPCDDRGNAISGVTWDRTKMMMKK